MSLSEVEKQRVLARVAAFERDTGVELVTAVLPRCDDHPELPWKGFAIGVALGATLVAAELHLDLGPELGGGRVAGALVTLGVTLSAGLLGALLAARWPAAGRALLDAGRAETEARQAAEGLFLGHELFATPERLGVLMLVATFEHRVVVLPDRGLREALPEGSLQPVVAAMAPKLAAGELGEAFAVGIDRLQALLAERGVRGSSAGRVEAASRLPDHLETPP